MRLTTTMRQHKINRISSQKISKKIMKQPNWLLTMVVLFSSAICIKASADDLADWGKVLDYSNRFVTLSAMNDEAILDLETQLVWQRLGSKEELSWNGARSICRLATTGKRMGWRLPSLHELSSLVDPSSGGLIGPFERQHSVYWTGTSVANDVNSNYSSDQHAYAIAAYWGYGNPSFFRSKSEKSGALCVRGQFGADRY